MADVLSVIFDRVDSHPGVHEYGRAIDRHLDRITGGGSGQSEQTIGFPGRVERHETGPIFILDPSDLTALAPLLDDVRAMARRWAKRSTGGEPKMLTVNVRYGPAAGKREYFDEHRAWRRVTVTTDPLTVAEHLDELIDFVLHMGRP